MGISLFNCLGIAMLFLALFLNEVFGLLLWRDSDFGFIIATAYMIVAITLSLWSDLSSEPLAKETSL